MLQGFKQFMVAGNVLDLAVTVVMGAAFGALVTALVKDFITPFIAVIIGRPDITGSLYGCSHQATRPMAIRLLAGLQKFLRPAVIQVLDDPLAAAQLGDAVLAA